MHLVSFGVWVPYPRFVESWCAIWGALKKLFAAIKTAAIKLIVIDLMNC